MKELKLNILCVSDYFLPGFKGGGPIKTLDNMRKSLRDKVTFSIFTRDRDLGSDEPYPGIELNRWTESASGPIYYASPDIFGSQGLKIALDALNFDIVYLNSFFSLRASISIYLTLRRYKSRKPILLAPRGEFSQGSMAVKKFKKLVFLRLIRFFELYLDVFWHASTPLEARDILRQFPHAEDKIYIAPDPIQTQSHLVTRKTLIKKSKLLRIVFISRISPMKNLDGLLEILNTVQTETELDIFGPIEDQKYWKMCEKKISALPENIRVKLHAPLEPDKVSSTFSDYDLFAFPTHGENFGHVIFEALASGTPVLISDQTPWKADKIGAVTVIPNKDTAAWRRAIELAAKLTLVEHEALRLAAFNYASKYASSEESRQANLAMFRAVQQASAII